ncbi:MAG: prepilin-type N-terminal cleavage/methylation domain-containing protein [Clostridiaceae bacterium]|nr:prepilin-type N-terminal cleavage/methylation domain-containing protein [Clostridiaceae bacterium]
MGVYFKNKEGLTLIEVIVSIALLVIIMAILSNFFVSNISYCKDINETLEVKQNAHLALNYIKKRIRELNRSEIQYFSDEQIFKGKDSRGESSWIDLSGKITYKRNTLLYFYKTTGELRVNKAGEHNVLTDHITNIVITELVEGELVEIEVFADTINYSTKTKLKIKY